eukprot:TRINITY_DN12492_c0_g1_i1.p1 TRINITY_DN12492_c0_g1~~TRINITY_DN12492_c0_g1_i1.p1  ORF type:complete len:573 (+),score=126.73 TRINITY_DN12492_c0_g1_i1:76-1794(+)
MAKQQAARKSAASKAMKVTKVKKAKRIQRLRGSQDSFRSLLLAHLKKQGGRKDLVLRQDVSKKAMDAMHAVPLSKRAGYPVKRAKGSMDPKNWKTVEGKPVIVDFARESWLPDDFGQGLKSTNPLSGGKGGSGGTYTVYMNPEGRTFYHKWQVEDATGEKYSAAHGWNGVLRQARLTLDEMRLDSDASFFKLLSSTERACLPKASEFHFAVVSARRTRSETGLKGIATVHTAFASAGVEPTWYVDADSVAEYRALGLKAVVGGKLTPSRNMALRDARKGGKVCVQCSDDISSWEYRHGPMAKSREMDAVNAAHDAAQQFVVSPVTAARFMLAKMRGAPEATKPRLGGVYCLGNCSRTFGGEAISRHHFIIGDFFVDDSSGLRFDESLSLKEDYDFTCSHLNKFGSVMRFNRLTISARHYSNEGGACSVRDAKGIQERKNISILMQKWPNAIFHHTTRQNEVNLRWKGAAADEEEGSRKSASKATKGTMKNKTSKSLIKKTAAFPPAAVLVRTGKKAYSDYINARCAKLAGKTVSSACGGSIKFKKEGGASSTYSIADLRYDLSRGFLAIKKK